MHFRHHWQSGSVTAAMALTTGLLASLAGTERLGLPPTLGTCGLLALLAVQALLQVADGSLMGGHLRLQSGFALEKLLEGDAVPDDLFAQMLTIFLAGLGAMVDEAEAARIA